MSTGVVGVGPNACKLHSSNDISLVKSNLFTTATTTTTTIKLYSVQVFFQPLCLFSNPFWPRVQHHTHISHFWQTTTFKNSFHQDEQHCRTFTSRRIYWEAWKRYEKEKNGWEIWRLRLCLDFFVLPTFFDSITAKLWTSKIDFWKMASSDSSSLIGKKMAGKLKLLILSWFLCLAYIFWQHNSKIVNK